MNCTDLIKIERVICDETIVMQDSEIDIAIGMSLSPGSSIDPEMTIVTVSAYRYDLKADYENNQLQLNLEFLIDKSISIIRPGLTPLLLKYSFVKGFYDLPITQIHLSEVQVELERIRCEVIDLKAEDNIQLNVQNASFSEWLTITAIIKLVFIDQISFPGPSPHPPCPSPHPPCPSPHPPCPSPSPPCPSPSPPSPPCLFLATPLLISPEIINGLEILKGKIRAQISEPLKKELLTEVDKTLKLFQLGRSAEAMAILNSIGNELQEVLNKTPSRKNQIGLIFGDLIRVNQIIKRVI